MSVKHFTVIAALTLLRAGSLFAWDNGQPATYVLGQPDFTSNVSGAGPNGMSAPYGIALDTTTQLLFVAQVTSHRVMVFDVSGGVTNNMNAAYVLGQPDFSGWRPNFDTNDPTTAPPNGLNWPVGLHFDASHNRLFVADQNNNRVLVFDFQTGLPISTPGRAADYVLGQANLTDPTLNQPNQGGVVNASGMDHPGSITLDPSYTSPTAQQLFVSDMLNNRILVFNLLDGITNGEPAVNVLGQANLVDPTLIQANRGGAVNAGGMNEPVGLHYDTTTRRLFVGDETNARVLVFDLSLGITTNGMNAYRVLGQPNPTSNTPGSTNILMGEASRAFYNPANQELFVTDESNNRLLVYDLSSGISDGMPASAVLGQLDFTSNAPDVSQRIGNHFEDVIYDAANQRLYTSDCTNNRVLVYSPPMAACSGLELCGTITSAESPNPPLNGVPVELLDGQGKLLATTKTRRISGNDGEYRFTTSNVSTLAAGNRYYVHPVVRRTQSSIPLQAPVPSMPGGGASNDFQIRGWPGTFEVSGAPAMSLVMVSTYNYTGGSSTLLPPSTGPGISSGSGLYSAIVGVNGKATVPVPAGSAYFLTCWLAQSSGSVASFTRSPTTGSQALPSIVPLQQVPVVCP